MNIKTIASEKLNKLFRNDQSKVFLFFAIVAIILATIIYKNIIILFIQCFLYYLVLEEINCRIYGGCILNSWIITFIPVVGIVIFVLDYFNIFKSIRKRIKFLFNNYEKLIPDGKINMKINNNEIPL
jgi:hypothetical protein